MSEYITTYTGKHFKPTEPDSELFDIADIAHALSLICRGNGHVKTFWSVGEASAVFGTEGFAGQGLKTLRWLTEECVPHIDRTFGVKDREHWLMGYSLAGLFALWAAYESDVFSGIVCCSGSLWFPDWDHYVRNHVIQSKCSVYLSLGGKEEKTKKKVMAAVGDRTRAQEGLLQEDSMVESVVLEWNAGGHFADAGKRLAKGVKWMFGVKSGL